MIKRKELQKKSLAAVMAASMTMSLLPGTALADATSGVLAFLAALSLFEEFTDAPKA